MSNLANVLKTEGLTRTKSEGPSNRPMRNNWIEEFFNRDIPSVFSQNFNSGMTLPLVNIRETSDAYFVDMAVPGLKKSDFKIDLENQLLSIETDTLQESEQNEENYTRREFGYSSFKRSFTLPDTVEESKIKAGYKDGILNIHLPKKDEAKQKPAMKIEIS